MIFFINIIFFYLDNMPAITRPPSLLPLDELRMDALRRLLSSHFTRFGVYKRAQIGQLADGSWLVHARDYRYHLCHFKSYKLRSCRYRTVSQREIVTS